MKLERIISPLKTLITNRHLTVLSTLLVLLSIGFIIYLSITVRPSELQLVTHYTAYGLTHLYRDQWFYLLSFIGFTVLSTFFYITLAIKTYTLKGHPLAIMLLWIGIVTIIFAWVTAGSIINVWSPVG